VISIDFQLDRIVLSKAGLGGVLNTALSYEKFPCLNTMPIKDLEHLGAALTLGLAQLEFGIADIAKQAAMKIASEVEDGPALVVPPAQLVIP